MLVDLSVKSFLDKVAGKDPVPGGGSIAALNGAIASSLAAMVAGLTIGKKGYEEQTELMNEISSFMHLLLMVYVFVKQKGTVIIMPIWMTWNVA